MPLKAAENKPLVPKAPKRGTIAEKIWNYLRDAEIFPRALTPKKLAAELRLREATIRKELLRMEDRGQVHNVDGTGWYRAWLDPGLLAFAERPEPAVHALQMKCIGAIGGGLGVPRGGRQAIFSGATERGWTVDESNDQATLTDTLPGNRRAIIQASSTGVIMLNIRASENPVRFEEWKEFYGYLKGWAHGRGLDLDAPTSTLVNVEFNVDWRQYFMDGIKRMKLQAVERAWAQIYQKREMGLRMELRTAPVGMTVSEAGAAIVALARYHEIPKLASPAPAPATEPAPWGQEVA